MLGPPDPSAVALLVDHRGRALGHGLYSPESAIVLRLLTFGETPPEADWLARRLDRALAARRALGLGEAETTGYREVNSEGDGLPGLVVDRFGDWRVVQITTAPMAARRQAIADWLDAHAPLPGGTIYLAPASAARLEGFAPLLRVEPRADQSSPERLHWREHGLSFAAPAPPAQKTGAYHDQRDNRRAFADLLSRATLGGPLLDLGTHVGGFAVYAAARGREVVAVDQRNDLLAEVRRNAEANQVTQAIHPVAADMFGDLDQPALAGPFAGAVIDPPKIATSRRDLPRATSALARTLTRILPRIASGGPIALCSCSHHFDGEALDRSMLLAAGRSGSSLTRIATWGPGPDHPIAPGHREGEYLRVRVYQLFHRERT